MAKSNAEKCREYRKRKKMEEEKIKLNNIVPTLNVPDSQMQQNTKNISKEKNSTPSTSTGRTSKRTQPIKYYGNKRKKNEKQTTTKKPSQPETSSIESKRENPANKREIQSKAIRKRIDIKKLTISKKTVSKTFIASKKLRGSSKENININQRFKEKSFSTKLDELKSSDFSEYNILFKKHFNENVRLNRLMMEQLIDIVLFLGKPDFAFRDNEKNNNSLRNDFIELFDMHSTRCSPELQYHYKKNKNTHPSLLKSLQDDLIVCISNYISNKIKEEIKQCMFYSIQIDGTINISQKTYCSIILRYLTNESELVERFLGFHNVSGDNAVESIFNLVLSTLHDFDMEHKLVSQCYNRTNINDTEDLEDIKDKVKIAAPNALLTLSLTDGLSSILQHACSTNTTCRIFFAKLSGMSAYFCESTSRSIIINNIVRKQFPQLDHSGWNSNSKMLHSIVKNQAMLITVLDIISNDPNSSVESICGAVHHLETLKSFEFIFLAQIFRNIFLLTDILIDALKDKPFDVEYCLLKINATMAIIGKSKKKSEYLNYFNEAVTLTGPPKEDSTNELKSQLELKLLFYDIIDIVLLQLNTKFQNTDKLIFLQLADVTKFRQYSSQFPESDFNNINVAYSNIFQDMEKLKTELEMLYHNEEYHNLKHIYDLVQLLENNNAKNVLSEVYKLFTLVLTITSTNVPVEGSFSGLERIKSYLRNINSNNLSLQRLNSLGLISIENSVIQRPKDTGILYDNIINIYATKDSENINLIYKT